MNKIKEIFDLLNLNEDGLFKVINPKFEGIFKLTPRLYINKLENDGLNVSIFQLSDLLNGTIEIEPIEKEVE